jgi:hypothetical protein
MPLLSPAPMIRMYETSAAGAPLAGGLLYTAQPGTVAGPGQSFPKASFTDSTGGVPNTNPVVFGSNGKADVWLNGSYSLALYDANGVLIESNSNVSAGGGSGGSGTGTGVDNISFFDATISAINVSIPSANDVTAIPQVIVKTDASANPVVITPNTGTILGQTSYSLTSQNESVRLVPQAASNDWKKGA